MHETEDKGATEERNHGSESKTELTTERASQHSEQESTKDKLISSMTGPFFVQSAPHACELQGKAEYLN